jgi:excisionase family DNA binding protein
MSAERLTRALGALNRGPSGGDMEAAAFGQDRRRRHHGSGLPKYYTIKAVAAALDVSLRTIRRRIANGDLIAHRSGGVVRISEADFRAFVALHREG